MNKKRKILIIVDWYYPGYKAGGPIQSCRNIVALLKNDFEILVFTSDRDIGDTHAYNDIVTNQWTVIDEGIKVFYAQHTFCTVKNIQSMINEVAPDLVYLNSMFSAGFSIKPLIALKGIKLKTKTVLAPRGMLHAGARKAKRLKKMLFLKGIKFSGLIRDVIFHATDQQEVLDIQRFFPKKNKIQLIENIPNAFNGDIELITKVKGEIRMIFLSRIHPKKNLLYLLKLLREVKDANVVFDIYGYIDDQSYYEKCLSEIAAYSNNVKVKFLGAIESNRVFEFINQYHLFVLPTLGENFGHAIYEALSVGRPVLISDLTPWRNLVNINAGWDISLKKNQEFLKVINEVTDWGQEEFNKWCAGASNYAKAAINNASLKESYLNLFSDDSK